MQTVNDMKVRKHATSLCSVLQQAAKNMDGVDLDARVTSCGKHVSHHYGPAHLLMRYDVIEAVKHSKGRHIVRIGPSWYALKR